MDITLDKYTFKYKKHTILNEVSYSFEKNNIYIIKGENGSGKTMLIRAIVGLIRPSSGKRLVSGNETTEILQDVGLSLSGMKLLEEYTGDENIKFLNKINKKVTEEEINKWFKFFDLEVERHKKVKEYSLGMNQKLILIQALMENAQVLCLDEPLNGLDDNSIKKLIMHIKESAKDKIIIIVSHTLEEFEGFDYTLLEMKNGTIQSQCDVKGLKEHQLEKN